MTNRLTSSQMTDSTNLMDISSSRPVSSDNTNLIVTTDQFVNHHTETYGINVSTLPPHMIRYMRFDESAMVPERAGHTFHYQLNRKHPPMPIEYPQEWWDAHDRYIREFGYVERELHRAPIVSIRDPNGSRTSINEYEEPHVEVRPRDSHHAPTPLRRSIVRPAGWKLVTAGKLQGLIDDMHDDELDGNWTAKALDQETLSLMQEALEEFVEDIVGGAAELSHHRGAESLETQDLLLFLEMHRPHTTHRPTEMLEAAAAVYEGSAILDTSNYMW